MEYDVHIFTVAKAKIEGINASSQEEALEKAKNIPDFHKLLDRDLPTYEYPVVHIEWAEEDAYYLVDEKGDEDFENSRWHDGAFQVVDRNGKLKPSQPKPLVGECPVCGEPCHSYGSIDIEEDFVAQSAYCEHCKSAWHDVYGLDENVIDDIGDKVPEVALGFNQALDRPGPYTARIDGKLEGVGDTAAEAKRTAIHSYIERLLAEEAKDGEAPEPEPTGLLLNKYKCPHCGHFWADVYECAVDMECPQCGTRDISPYDSEEVVR